MKYFEQFKLATGLSYKEGDDFGYNQYVDDCYIHWLEDSSNPWLEEKVLQNLPKADAYSLSGEVPSGSLCEICNKKIDDLKGNPDLWGVALPYQDGNGKMKYYHRGCVATIIARHFA